MEEQGILSAVGSTPLIRLRRVLEDIDFSLYAKLEALNPGGSIKDRTALSIMKRASDVGEIRPGTTVVESSSGNMGIGLAQTCSYLGLRFVCVVDPKTTSQNIRLLEAYGAEIEMVTEPDPFTGEFLQSRLNRVEELLAEIENAFWPNQYANEYNAMAHHQTMHEIVMALDGRLDYLFCSTSTCGTLRGCADYIRSRGLKTKVVAVDAIGSVIFSSPISCKRLIPGHGISVKPKLFRSGLADHYVHVSDLDCIVGCRRLSSSEAVLAGGSSGAVLAAVDRMKRQVPAGAVCAMIFPDRGERYLDTIYSDSWIARHFGDISHLWNGRLKTPPLNDRLIPDRINNPKGRA